MKINNMRQGDVATKFGDSFQVKPWKGSLYVAKWPRKRGPQKNKLNKIRNDWFSIVNEIGKYTTPGQIRASMQLAPHGALYPRDYLMSAMAGRMYTIQLDTGETIYPMSLLNEISKDLDVIQKQRGGMIFRGQQLWTPLNHGNSEDELGWDGVLEEIVWRPPSALTGGLCCSFIPPTTAGSAAEATQGWWAFLNAPMRITAAMPTFNAAINGSYFCTIVELNVWTISRIVATSATHVSPATGFRRVSLAFDNTEILTPGTKYGVLCTRSDSTSTTPVALYNSTDIGSHGMPLSHNAGFLTFTTTAPAVSQVAARNGSGGVQFPVDVFFRM